MATFGRACLLLALAVALYGAVASLYGARTGRAAWVASGRRAVYALAGLSAAAFVTLEIAFVRSDFSLTVVATHSSTTTPLFYQLTAPWSSQEGSLLLWLLLLATWSSLVLFLTRRRLRDVAPYATAVLLGLGAFFAALLVALESPFAQTLPPPPEGTGLNPLLRHPSMATHPILLYSGYTLFAIPFAFAIGALVARRVDAEWIRATRRFALGAWLALGVGILLGARWSYVELGWGGYWAWDPVENASLLPWLTGTAFLHSIMVQERRGMLKAWNASLVLATGILALMGTFLVRSGILDSIHAFGASTLGIPFVALIGVLLVGSVALVVARREDLRSEHRLDGLLSRESVFLANNLVLVALAVVIWFGTFFPLISEAVTGEAASVGPPWFNRYTVPLALVLAFLSGLGPLVAWRRASWTTTRRTLRLPAAAGVAVLVAGAALGALDRPLALLAFAFSAFVVAGVAQELWRGAAARRVSAAESPVVAVVNVVRRNRRRYGGYLVHAGMALLFVGVAASSAFQEVESRALSPGDRIEVDGLDVTYVRATAGISSTPDGTLEKIDLGAVLDVRRDGEHVATLHPERGFYPSLDAEGLGPIGRFFEGEATSEIGLDAGATRDLWTAMTPDIDALKPVIDEGDRAFVASLREGDITMEQASVALTEALRLLTDRYEEQPPAATFRLMASPLVSFIWLGALVIVAGTLIALWPAPDAVRRRATAGHAARVARELGRA
jgi:cytochrome c-type biogenesis protein CcmF